MRVFETRPSRGTKPLLCCILNSDPHHALSPPPQPSHSHTTRTHTSMSSITHFPHAGTPFSSLPSVLFLCPPGEPTSAQTKPSSPPTLTTFTGTCVSALLPLLSFPCSVTLAEVHCNKLYPLTPSPVRVDEVKSLRRCPPSPPLSSGTDYASLLTRYAGKLDSATSFVLQLFESSGKRVLVCTVPAEAGGLQVRWCEERSDELRGRAYGVSERREARPRYFTSSRCAS